MQIMFNLVVCGRIILRWLIVKTIIFDKCLFMDEHRRFAVCLFRNPTLHGCRISHKQPLKHKYRKSANKQSAMTKTRLIPLSNIDKSVISDKKQSVRTERSINIGKKTIQVSNFHNAAETDVNLTGRRQILIQKSRCLFFDGKTAVSSKTILNRTKYGLIFRKREKGFSFEKDLERNEIFCRSVFRKRKGFLFCAQPNGKIALYFLPKSYRGGKRHLFKRCQIG